MNPYEAGGGEELDALNKLASVYTLEVKRACVTGLRFCKLCFSFWFFWPTVLGMIYSKMHLSCGTMCARFYRYSFLKYSARWLKNATHLQASGETSFILIYYTFIINHKVQPQYSTMVLWWSIVVEYHG
jgi:hypothetical protein